MVKSCDNCDSVTNGENGGNLGCGSLATLPGKTIRYDTVIYKDFIIIMYCGYFSRRASNIFLYYTILLKTCG